MSEQNKLTRRQFIKDATIAGAAVATAGVLGTTSAQAQTTAPWLPAKWDYETDIVIVGIGFAGQGAAIEARAAGAKVIVVEKAPKEHAGGNSSAKPYFQGCYLGKTQEAQIQYLRSECWGSVEDDDVLKDHVIHTRELPAFVESIGGTIIYQDVDATYPTIPGGDIWSFKAADKAGFGGYPPQKYLDDEKADKIRSPWWEWMVAEVLPAKGVSEKDGTLMFSTPATELIQDGNTKEIIGIKALKGVTTGKDFHYTGGTPIYIKAKLGVIMACGGYENNLAMLHQTGPVPHSAYETWYGSPYNQGDGVKMATKVGAQLWHLNKKEAHNMACAAASKELATGRTVGAWATGIANGPGIIVNRTGRRFFNEYFNGGHSDDRREWDRFMHKLKPADDLDFADYPNVPFYWIFDDTRMKSGPVGNNSQFTWTRRIYDWSKDNQAELAKGWFIKADTIEALAKQIVCKDFFGRVVGMDPAGLVDEINKYNQYCAAGKDLDFGRRPTTMKPIITPPFYAMELIECLTNTQGGPKHNRYCQTLDAFDQPIPRLYNVGELGSIFGALYNGCENLPEAMSNGRTAAKHALALKPLA